MPPQPRVYKVPADDRGAYVSREIRGLAVAEESRGYRVNFYGEMVETGHIPPGVPIFDALLTWLGLDLDFIIPP